MRLDGDEETGRLERLIQESVHHLEAFALRVRALPIGNLPRKHHLLRDEMQKGLQRTGEVLEHYSRLFDKVDKAISPFMGIVSFTPGGTSDFYVRWFGRLKDFLDFELPFLQGKAGDLKATMDREQTFYLEKHLTAQVLEAIITPNIAQVIQYRLPIAADEEEEQMDVEPRKLSAQELATMLADYYCLISYLHAVPRGLFGVERDIFYNVRKKRTFAIEVLRHGMGRTGKDE